MEVTTAQMKELERRANENGLSYRQMMENAGAAAVRALKAHVGMPATAAVFCGTGNNGGDGLVMARLLAQAGCRVRVFLPEGAPATPEARANYSRLAGLPVLILCGPLSAQDAVWARDAAAVIDALYGTGFHGALRPAGAAAAACINAGRGFVLAADVPSGLCADTGRAADGAVKADLTVAFHAAKPCHRLAAEVCGTVEVADIGIR